jgi:hypothetical protein
MSLYPEGACHASTIRLDGTPICARNILRSDHAADAVDRVVLIRSPPLLQGFYDVYLEVVGKLGDNRKRRADEQP